MMHPTSSPSIASDIDVEKRNQNGKEDMAKKVLGEIDKFIKNADTGIEDLEKNQLLGPAIVRGCKDLADAVANLAEQLEQQSDGERRLLSQALMDDSMNMASMNFGDGDATEASWEPLSRSNSYSNILDSQRELTTMTEDDIMAALSAAATLLRDVEYGLRAVDEDEADEIADAALTLARLFITSLQSFNPDNAPSKLIVKGQSADNVEALDDDDKTPRIMNNHNDSQTTETQASDEESEYQERLEKLRVLWPPLGPAVGAACEWGKDEAVKKPMLAVALGFTLWPAAVFTAFVGTPLVAADFVVQNVYNNFNDTPVIQGLESGAAQLFHAGKLSFLCSKLVGRQTLRVVKRQLHRHGGPGQIALNITQLAIHRILNPIETIGMAYNSISWGVGIVHENIQRITNQPSEEEIAAATLEQ